MNYSHRVLSAVESGYSDVTSTGDIEMIVVVFQPHAAKIFFRMPVTLLHDKNVAVADIENLALRDLARRVEDSENHDTCIELIEDYFYKCLDVWDKLSSATIGRSDTPYQQLLSNKYQDTFGYCVFE